MAGGGCGPSGRNQCAVQLSAPRKARVATVASPWAQLAALDALGDERPDAALVAIALGDDRAAQAGRQGVDFEMGGGPLDVVQQAEDVAHGEAVQARPDAGRGPSWRRPSASIRRSSDRSWQK